MIEKGSIVRLKENKQKILNPDMIDWMSQHKDSKFYVEYVNDRVAKLSKVSFAITLDLLEKI